MKISLFFSPPDRYTICFPFSRKKIKDRPEVSGVCPTQPLPTQVTRTHRPPPRRPAGTRLLAHLAARSQVPPPYPCPRGWVLCEKSTKNTRRGGVPPTPPGIKVGRHPPITLFPVNPVTGPHGAMIDCLGGGGCPVPRSADPVVSWASPLHRSRRAVGRSAASDFMPCVFCAAPGAHRRGVRPRGRSPIRRRRSGRPHGRRPLGHWVTRGVQRGGTWGL